MRVGTSILPLKNRFDIDWLCGEVAETVFRHQRHAGRFPGLRPISRLIIHIGLAKLRWRREGYALPSRSCGAGQCIRQLDITKHSDEFMPGCVCSTFLCQGKEQTPATKR
jgi:hypothetical protein